MNLSVTWYVNAGCMCCGTQFVCKGKTVVIVLKVLIATIQNSVDWVHRYAEFVHPWCALLNHVVTLSNACVHEKKNCFIVDW